MKTIRGRILNSYLLLLMITLPLMAVVLTFALRDYYLSLTERNLTTQARWISQSSIAYLREDAQNSLRALVGGFGSQHSLRVTVTDAKGVVIADTDADPSSMENHAARPEIAAALIGRVGRAQRTSGTTQWPFLYVAVPVDDDGAIIGAARVALPLSDVNAAIGRLWMIVIFSLLLAMALAAFIGMKLARRITEPIEQLSQAAQEVAKGRYWHRVSIGNRDEIGQLGETINHMATSIQEKIDLISEGKEQLEVVLRQMVSGVLLLERNDEVTVINPAARTMLGFDGPISGLSVLDVTKSRELADACQRVLLSGETASIEVRVIYPRERILQVDVSPMRHTPRSGPVAIVMVLHDISRRKQEERYRAELVANVSHELRTPVTAIKGFADTLLEEAADDPQATKEFVQIIAKEANRLNLLIADLLELARIEAQEIQLHRDVIDVRELIAEVLLRFKTRAQEQQLEITTDCPPSLTVWADRERIIQIISNLVDNSIKYTSPGGRITLNAFERGDRTEIAVADTGVGIPADDLKRVFERFYRVEKARSRKLGGTGLGLSIVKHLVELHQGRIWLESEVGKGTTAHLTLPRSEGNTNNRV